MLKSERRRRRSASGARRGAWTTLCAVGTVALLSNDASANITEATYAFQDGGPPVPIALEGAVTIEPRLIAGTPIELRVRFESPVLAFGAAESSAGTIEFLERAGDELVFRLTDIQDARYHTLSIFDVQLDDGRTLPGVGVPLGFLVGDIDGDRDVTVLDLLVTMERYFQGDLRADTDRSGDLDIGDLLVVIDGLLGETILANMPPMVGAVPDVSVAPGLPSDPTPLNLRDDLLLPEGLVVEVSSSNPSAIGPDDVVLFNLGGVSSVSVLTNAPIGASATITLTISDGPNTVVELFTVSVREANAPQARMSASAYWGAAPLTVTFDSAPSIRGDGQINAYAWDVDGTPVPGDRITRTFQAPGEYTVSLEVFDLAGNSDRIERIVTVSDGAYSPSDPISETDARRFLWQAAFGPTDADVAFIVANGYEAWIDQQIAASPSEYSAEAVDVHEDLDGESDRVDSLIDDYWIGGDDQLRQRMIFALSQVVTINLNEIGAGNGRRWPTVRTYSDNAFGGYRQLLDDVTFSKAMSNYLTYRNNRKADPENGTFPDENYAREIAQLFTIGLIKLNRDGTPDLDESGQPIETYDNDAVEEFARIFTGLRSVGSDDASFVIPLEMNEDWHDHGQKQLLDYPGAVPAGGVVPASAESPENGIADVRLAIDNLFNHPNCPPFVSRLLIMRFTLSNPSPAYIDRVAAVFEDNGQGTRGDLAAVLKAVLLDPEARDPAYRTNPAYGKRIEPLIVYYGLARSLGLEFDRETEAHPYRYDRHPDDLGQYPWRPPTVFNFYQPDYAPPNTDIERSGHVAPEFQIHNSATASSAHNEYRDLLRRDHAKYGEWLAAAGTDVDLMIDEALRTFSHAGLSAPSRAIIRDAMLQIDTNRYDGDGPRFAAALIALSPEFMVIR